MEFAGGSEPPSETERENPHAGRRTVFATFLLLAAFQGELLLVEYTSAPAPISLVEGVSPPLAYAVYPLLPILHSSADHLATNLLVFVPLSYLLEQRTSVRAYLVFVYGVGLLSVMVAPWMVQLAGIGVALGIGASGITHALAAREAVHRAGELADAEAATRRNATIFLLVALLTAQNVVVLYRGATPTGASVVGHAAGLVSGLVVGSRDAGLLQALHDVLVSAEFTPPWS